MRKFLLERVELVRQLIDSQLPWHYADCALILCSVMSACAADRWPSQPKERIDRRRFTELLVGCSPPDAHAEWVSVPALIVKGLVEEKDTPYGLNGSRIFKDEEIDLPLADAALKYPGVNVQALKNNCYATLIYEWLRCGFAHQYWGNENTTPYVPSRDRARISYIGRGEKGGGHRRIAGFHLEYLVELAEHHAGDVEDKPRQRPSKWWLDP
jgi:hypothetical protein